MKQDEFTSLAFSIYSNKGVYALLLGAGLSKSAGILTGWEIILDLIRKLASQVNAVLERDEEEKWYTDKYNEEPNYSKILNRITDKPEERKGILKEYFEPKNDDGGKNQPSKAHRSIARLAKKDYFKVILTTNFDRLLEQALRDEGIEPAVIYSLDGLNGATPLVHAPLTIIKINGDYLDSRFKNTEDELSDYPEEFDKFLNRIFDEYGLITCGWSAKWDTGLKKIINSVANRRYSTFFTCIGEANTELQELSKQRSGKMIKISDADIFFKELEERIEAIQYIDRHHPLDKEILIARVKRYIQSNRNIEFEDLFQNEVERAVSIIAKDNYSQSLYDKLFNEFLLRHVEAIDSLVPMSIYSLKWGNKFHEIVIKETLLKLSGPANTDHSNLMTINCHYFGALIYLYVIGIACIYFKRFKLLNDIFREKIYIENHAYSRRDYIIRTVNPSLFTIDEANILLGLNNHHPFNFKIKEILNPFFKEIIYQGNNYDSIFVAFEYLLSLYYPFILKKDSIIRGGRITNLVIAKTLDYTRTIGNPFIEFLKDADRKKDEWEPIKQGMFNGSYQEYLEINKEVFPQLENIIEEAIEL